MTADSNDHGGETPLRRLFPIPGLVVFPGVVQGLHVFEPRYRALMKDALADDKTFVLATPIGPATEAHPQLAEHGCLVQVLDHRELPDGKFDASVVGVARVRLVDEGDLRSGYRQAHVQVVPDCPTDTDSEAATSLHAELSEMFRELLSFSSADGDPLADTMEQTFSIDLLTHLVAYVIPFPIEWKLELLKEVDPCIRARRLIEMRNQMSRGTSPSSKSAFPPDFSVN